MVGGWVGSKSEQGMFQVQTQWWSVEVCGRVGVGGWWCGGSHGSAAQRRAHLSRSPPLLRLPRQHLVDPPPGEQELKERHREVLQELLMDILRALASPNLDIRAKTLVRSAYRSPPARRRRSTGR